MCRLCRKCLPICCISQRKSKSFPIHDKHHEIEINKITIRHVETIRITPPPPPITINHQQDNNKKSKLTINNKSNNTKSNDKTYLSDQQTSKEINSTHSRSSLSKSFHKSIHLKTPSPLPMTINDIPEKNLNKTDISTSSSWSSSTTTTNSLPNQHKKTSKHPSCVETYDSSKKSISQLKNIPNDITPAIKSKVILENVRKMIKDQNIQQEHFHHTRQYLSAQL